MSNKSVEIEVSNELQKIIGMDLNKAVALAFQTLVEVKNVQL